MSAVLGSYNNEMDTSYAADFSRDREPMKKRSRHPEYRRKGSAPTRVNGMHCRRNKRWTWGRGRSARLQDVRSFGCALLACVAAFAGVSTVQAQINPANIVQIAASVSGTAPNGAAAVSTAYWIGKYEVTNAEYAAFLTSVGGTNSTYNANMQITQSGATYTANSGFANKPVQFVSWFSAARYVNWLQTGSTENGAYTLGGITSGSAVARNGGAQIFLPSSGEWSKAAYFSPTANAWVTWATGTSAATPVASAPTSTPNTGNFNNIVGNVADVGSYTTSASAYGVFDMLGNVAETLDTLNGSGQVVRTGGNWSQAAIFSSASPLTFSNAANANANIGFRIAGVAAVPEPETITLAAFGIVGLCGANWLKRRRSAGGRAVHLAA